MTVQQKSYKLTERQVEILALVEEHGYATLESLAERYNVSMQTVRRDVIALSNAERLQRFHGGAGPIEREEATRLDYHAKRNIAQLEKTEIGKNAARHIADRSTLFLDVGTTIEACASALASKRGLTIFTNSLPTAMKFDPQEHSVFVLGGRMAGRDGSVVGLDAVNQISEVNFDYALIACSTVDESGRVMDFDIDKIAIKKAAMKAAGQSFLLATQSKFGRSALAVIEHIERFDNVFSSSSQESEDGEDDALAMEE